MRHVSHPDAVSGHAAASQARGRGTAPPPRLESLRPRTRRVSSEADDPSGARAGLCLALSETLLARLDLAPPAQRLAGGHAVSRDVVPLQALESILALSDSATAGERRVAPARRAHPPATSQVSTRARRTSRRGADTLTRPSRGHAGGLVRRLHLLATSNRLWARQNGLDHAT